MLKGLDPLLSPDLLHAVASMGHGDRLAVVDANFPAASMARRLVLLPGAGALDALRAILSVLPLDDFVADPVHVMQPVGAQVGMPEIVQSFARYLGTTPASLDRHAFYREAASAYAIVLTGERRFYGNILLTKGVVPPSPA